MVRSFSGCHLVILILLAAEADDDFKYTEVYAAKRSDYYLRRAHEASIEGSAASACAQLLEAALEISPSNTSVASRLQDTGCKAISAPLGSPAMSLQIPPVRSWHGDRPSQETCPTASEGRFKDLFPTPLGFLHASELGLKDWQKTLKKFGLLAKKKFAEVQARRKDRFVSVNNNFFSTQDTNPESAIRQPNSWPELYTSREYKEWAEVTRGICTSFVNKMGVPLTEEEAKQMEVVTWAAVYPEQQADDPVTHYYHAHQESIVSFVLYVRMPEPTTPLTISDPRGAPPIEDFEWFQEKGDLGVDGEPPFHRPAEFFADEGDVLIFPSFAIHKVPPHIGHGTRVVFPSNCHLPKKPRQLESAAGGRESPLDGWERIAKWPEASYRGRDSTESYAAHAAAVVKLARKLQDPYMKMWEAQNQVLAMLQFGHARAETWLAAGNISAHIAVILDSRGEGEYYLDAALMFARALRLDSGIKLQVDDCLDKLVPKKVTKKYKEAYREMQRWRNVIKSWGTEPPDLEVTHFLHPEVNGAGKCRRMCAVKADVEFKSLRILPVFSSRIFIRPALEDGIIEAASFLWEVEAPGAVAQLQLLAEGHENWRRHEAASIIVVLCDENSHVWFADPRGAWPDRWAGAVPRQDGLGSEPKAPFHWHSEVECSKGEAVLFPSWLSHRSKKGTRTYAISLSDRGLEALGWRLPRPQLLCSEDIQMHRVEL